MKTIELKMLWKLVKSGEDRPLSAADLALLLRIRFALQEYEKRDKRSSGAAFERQARAPVRSSVI
jgi:hypothetical protein